MTETDETIETISVGDRLRASREEQGLTLEDIAARTRIPLRHLEAIEANEWDRLPAPTYTIGFAKSYASTLGLDRNDIGDQIRAEAGGPRMATTAEPFEPVDPARSMPKWLVLGAIVAIVLAVVVMSWLSSRSLQPNEVPATSIADEPLADMPVAPTPAPQAAPAAQTAQGEVVLTATAPAWIRITDSGRTLFEGVLSTGQRFAVPPTATAPMLRAGAPEALQVTVGGTPAPPVGSAGVVASNVSLLGPDLMRTGQPQTADTQAADTQADATQAR